MVEPTADFRLHDGTSSKVIFEQSDLRLVASRNNSPRNVTFQFDIDQLWNVYYPRVDNVYVHMVYQVESSRRHHVRTSLPWQLIGADTYPERIEGVNLKANPDSSPTFPPSPSSTNTLTTIPSMSSESLPDKSSPSPDIPSRPNDTPIKPPKNNKPDSTKLSNQRKFTALIIMLIVAGLLLLSSIVLGIGVFIKTRNK